MAACLADDRRGVSPVRSKSSSGHQVKLKVLSPPSQFELDRIELLEGSGQWENIQDVLRSAVVRLLDTQAAHEARLQAHEKELRQVQALLIKNARNLESEQNASREYHARAAVTATENASALAKLRSEISAAKDVARAEAINLTARLEGKASKELLKASLEGKANQGELVEMRGRIGRLCSEAGEAEMRGRQVLHERAMALEKRMVEVEARVRGCEALAVRADPGAVALRMEGVLSDLRDLGKRLGRKADAAETERALHEKIDKADLDASLKSKPDRADLSKATAALNARTDRQYEALSRLSRAVVDAKETGERACERGLRDAEGRLESLERGMGMVAAAADGALEKAERASRAVDRCKRRDIERVDSKARAVADAVRSLAERVEDCEPSRYIAEIEQLVHLRVTTSEDEQAMRVSALSERVSMLERSYGKKEPLILPVNSAGIRSEKGTNEKKHAVIPSPGSGSGGDGNRNPSEMVPNDGRPRERPRQAAARGNTCGRQKGDREGGISSGSGLMNSSLSKPFRSIPKPKPQPQPDGLGGGRERHSVAGGLPVDRYRCSLGMRTYGAEVVVPRGEGRSPSTGVLPCADRDGSKGAAVSRRVEGGGGRRNRGRREATGEQVTTMLGEGGNRLKDKERGARSEDGEAWELLRQMPASAAAVASDCVLDDVGSRDVSPIKRTATTGSSGRCFRGEAAASPEREVTEGVGGSKKRGSRAAQGGACGETWNPFAGSMTCEGYCSGGSGSGLLAAARGDERFSHASTSAAVARRLEELRREKEAFRRVMTREE